jgi:putative transposase
VSHPHPRGVGQAVGRDMRRKQILATGETYHVFNRSIAKYVIFSRPEDFARFKQLLQYYQKPKPSMKFSDFMHMSCVHVHGFDRELDRKYGSEPNVVDILAYCIMPTHFHLILKQNVDHGIAQFMSHILYCYTRYLNTRRERSGPLWDGRFKNVLIESDEQLLHTTRYVHLNPVTDYLVDSPSDWEYSSYHEYVSSGEDGMEICRFRERIEMKRNLYKQFVADYIQDQRHTAHVNKSNRNRHPRGGV